MLILVTGATGYIASRLIPQLLDRGCEVRALARDPRRLRPRNWFNSVNIVQGDVLDSASLASAMKDVHTAYYLIHNMSSGHGYTRIEIQAAQNFARAAEKAGVKHIIYLGGLADPQQHIAPHMRSRIETGVTLRKGSVPVTEFRAGVIAGSGSISFEMIRFMVELLPIIPAPTWLNNKAQPIAAQNVIDYLVAALDNRDGQGQVFEIGGPKVTTYQNLMESYARARGLKRRFLLLPYIPIEFMAFGIGLTTPVPRPIARALVGGLSRDSMVLNNNAHAVYPIKLIYFESVAKDALDNLHPHNIEHVWGDNDRRALNPFKHEGFFIDQRTAKINAAPGEILDVIQNFRVRRFTLESKSDSEILFHSSQTTFGEHWLEWRVGQVGNLSCITQTAYFAPRGFIGFLHGYLLYPFHAFVFRKVINNFQRG
jgi:uncharacterized protein YbjT (DUF2867 family)